MNARLIYCEHFLGTLRGPYTTAVLLGFSLAGHVLPT